MRKQKRSLKSRIEDEYVYDDLSSSNTRPSRKEKKEHLKQKRLQNQFKKKKRWEVKHSVFFASTIVLMLCALIIWATTLIVSPVHKISANIVPTVGGFNIEYPILTQDIREFPSDVEVGDTYYMTDFGRLTNTRRNNLKVVVNEIDNNKVKLKVDNAELPTFVSMDDFLSFFKDSGKSKQFSSVYIHGKIAGGRFVLSKITTQ